MTRFGVFYLALLPFTRLGVSAGSFRITVSDMIISILFVVVMKNGIKKDKFYPFSIVLSIFIAAFLSLFNIQNTNSFFINLLPFIVGLMQMIVFYTLVMQGTLDCSSLVRGITRILWVYAGYGILEMLGLIHLGYFYVGDAYRLSGPTANPNALVMYLVSLYTIVTFADITKESASNTSSLTGIVLLPTVMLTGSITGVACYLILLFLSFFRVKKSILTVYAVLGLFILSNIELQNFRSFSRIKTFYDNGFTGNQVDVRTSQWEVGSSLISEHPLFGVGLGQFKHYWHHEMHNTVLMILFEFGVIGFVVVLLGIILYLINLFSRIRTIKVRILVSIMLTAYFIMHLTHNYMRERWTWILLVILPMILWSKMRNKQSYTM